MKKGTIESNAKIALPVEELFQMIGVTRTAGYGAIAKGELKTYKIGRRRYGTRKAAEEFVARKEREGSGAA